MYCLFLFGILLEVELLRHGIGVYLAVRKSKFFKVAEVILLSSRYKTSLVLHTHQHLVVGHFSISHSDGCVVVFRAIYFYSKKLEEIAFRIHQQIRCFYVSLQCLSTCLKVMREKL